MAGDLATGPTSVQQAQRVRTVRRVFFVCLGYTSALTVFWLYLMFSGRQNVPFFPQYRTSVEQLAQLAWFFAIFFIAVGYLFYVLKYWLLKKYVGLDAAELKMVFSNRLSGFDLDALLARHSERRLRIADMIGRRGRWAPLALVGFLLVYLYVRQNPGPESLLFGVQASLIDGLLMSWWWLLSFHSNGLAGRIAYGAIARTLDGVQGRANSLFIGTLWSCFRFVMVPIALGLTKIYPPETYASLFAFIWLSYIVTDYASEIFGSLFGRHHVRVWGLGDMNKKSWEGVAAGFASMLILTGTVVSTNGLPPVWIGLGLLLSVTNPLVELYSPRGTDDFTMATSNALLCLGYGWLFIR